MKRSIIGSLLFLLLCAAPLAAAVEDWLGDWEDTQTKALFTVELVSGKPQVTKAYDQDDDTSYTVQRSTWVNNLLSWTVYIPATEVTLSYSATALRGDSMDTTWENDWSSGTETLARAGLEGVWVDREINVYNTIERMGDGYKITRVFDSDDNSEYSVLRQSWRNNRLSWSFFIPATEVTLSYTTKSLSGGELQCEWENGTDSGEETLYRATAGNAVPAENLEGVWADETISAYFYIYLVGGTPTVTYCYDTDEEDNYEITDQSWQNGKLTWSIYIAQNDVTLTYATTGLEDGNLHTDWWNSADASGSGDLLFVSNPLLKASDLYGAWTDTDINVRFTIEAGSKGPTVTSAYDTDIADNLVVTDCSWKNGVLAWSIYLYETEVAVTYWANAISNGRLVTSWYNEFDWGNEYLESGSGAGSTGTPITVDIAGHWVADGNNTDFYIEKHGDRYDIMSAIDQDDNEHFVILSQSWSNGVLTWEYYVPSTGYTVSNRSTGVSGNVMNYDWSNDHGNSGSGVMRRK